MAASRALIAASPSLATEQAGYDEPTTEVPMRALALMLTLSLVACGGDAADTDAADTDASASGGNLSGLYQTDAHFENEGDCEGRGTEITPVPYVKLEQTADQLLVTFCPETDRCPPTPDLEWSYAKVGTEWEGVTTNGYVSEQDAVCVKILNRRTFKQEGAEVTLIRKEFRQFETGISNNDRCFDAAASWDGAGEDQCSSQTVVATKL
jgi:hypothetical protein